MSENPTFYPEGDGRVPRAGSGAPEWMKLVREPERHLQQGPDPAEAQPTAADSREPGAVVSTPGTGTAVTARHARGGSAGRSRTSRWAAAVLLVVVLYASLFMVISTELFVAAVALGVAAAAITRATVTWARLR